MLERLTPEQLAERERVLEDRGGLGALVCAEVRAAWAERDESRATLERLSALFEAGWGVVRTYEADLARPPKAAEALESVNRARNRLMAACGWEERGQEALRRIRDATEATWGPGAGLLRPTTHDMREAARWGLGERERAPWEEDDASA